MKLTKHGHAAVSVERDGRRLVIDAGAFTDPGVVDGADALLITHEHADHFVEATVRAKVRADPGLQVYCHRAVADQLAGLGSNLHVVGEGDSFEAAGLPVSVHGQMHAVIHPDIPRITNIGFLLDGQVFHPGDALTDPGVDVSTLLLPVHAPWSRTADLIDWVREVAPDQTLAVHDGLLNDTGLQVVGRLLSDSGPGTGARYQRLSPGEALEV